MWKIIAAYFISWLAAVTGSPASDISWRMFFLRNNRRLTAVPLNGESSQSGRIERSKLVTWAIGGSGVAACLSASLWGYRYWTVTTTINDIWLEQTISEQVSKQRSDSGKLPVVLYGVAAVFGALNW